MKIRRRARSAVVILSLILLAGCSTNPSKGPTSSASAEPTTEPADRVLPPVRLTKTLVTGLQVPWGVVFLPDGSALVGERPTGRVSRVQADGSRSSVGVVPGVADQGEGGLLGLTFRAPSTVFAYLTSTAGDNRVIRMTFDGRRLGAPKPILTGITAAGHHNGGLVTIGPDGKLWIGTGEAGITAHAQDRGNLGGKILRLNLDGSIPADNPFPGSPVYSLGHRNVQGLAFDSLKQPWAVEFGQDTWDELNRIVPGGNYGWPIVEGQEAHASFIPPLVQWHTD